MLIIYPILTWLVNLPNINIVVTPTTEAREVRCDQVMATVGQTMRISWSTIRQLDDYKTTKEPRTNDFDEQEGLSRR